MAALISDDVVDLFAVVGSHDVIADKIAARYEGLADTLSLLIPTDTDPVPLGEVVHDIQRISILFSGDAGGWQTVSARSIRSRPSGNP